MSALTLVVVEGERLPMAAALERAWSEGQTVALALPQEAPLLAAALPVQADRSWGASVVLGTGGSRGGRRWCLQPLRHLQVAVDATAVWLQGLGLEPARLELFNPLPLQHVSGLQPLLRARAWGSELRWLEPELMRHPERLPMPQGQAVLSLVPTQLHRLVEGSVGQRWLERFALIWVGGAALPQALADRCRQLGLPLSPCYGSTETGAMVAALAPQRFLAGVEGCGLPLPHAELRLDPLSGALQIRAGSLALGFVAGGALQPLPMQEGWWSSGDRAALTADGVLVQGRLDGAIQSGGETVFPEQVEQRLLQLARAQGLALEELLVLPEADPLWGERLVALVKPAVGIDAADAALCPSLQTLALSLPPSQRPRRWLPCPELQRSPLGKWERWRWSQWLISYSTSQPAPAP